MAKDWNVIPTTREGFENDRVIFVNVNIPPALIDKTKVEVVYDVPLVSDGLEAMEEMVKGRYECDLQTVINRGIRSISTGPNYPSFVCDTDPDSKTVKYIGFKPEFVNENGEPDLDKIASTYQDAADNCVAARKAEPGKATIVKKKAAKLDSLNEMAKKLGYGSVEEFMAAQAG
jgi:hypothetical protein